MLKITNLQKTFNKGTVNAKTALDGLNLHIKEGDFVTVIGGNGAGKSTLQNAIAGVWKPDFGTIEIDGVDVTNMPEHKRAAFLGRVFQDPMRGTAPDMEIAENLCIASKRGIKRRFTRGVKKADRDYYRELLVTAREQNVIIALENMPMPQFSIGSPEQILRFVTEINDPYMKVCLDTGHVSVYDKRQPSEAVYLLGDWIKVLHIHDNAGRSDEHLLPCSRTGVIDWQAFGRALRDIGYTGTFSYETAPTGKLPQPVWEDVCRSLVKLGHWIVGEEGEF